LGVDTDEQEEEITEKEPPWKTSLEEIAMRTIASMWTRPHTQSRMVADAEMIGAAEKKEAHTVLPNKMMTAREMEMMVVEWLQWNTSQMMMTNMELTNTGMLVMIEELRKIIMMKIDMKKAEFVTTMVETMMIPTREVVLVVWHQWMKLVTIIVAK
jgi:hypothetical protein